MERSKSLRPNAQFTSAKVEAAHDNDNDAEALAELFESARPALTREADRRMPASLRAKCGVSDIVQEVILDANRRLDQFRGQSEGEWRGWLLAILRNRLKMARRHYLEVGKRRAGLEVSIGRPDSAGVGRAFEPIDPSASPGGKAVRREQEARLVEALDRLPEGDRQVVRWHHEERLTFEQIAGRLGISMEAARKRWGRALVRLRETLKEVER
ncbi:MAG: sigma-70 family RNA polymerase sigma factor [Isosphaeraceae bacterium]